MSTRSVIRKKGAMVLELTEVEQLQVQNVALKLTLTQRQAQDAIAAMQAMRDAQAELTDSLFQVHKLNKEKYALDITKMTFVKIPSNPNPAVSGNPAPPESESRPKPNIPPKKKEEKKGG